MLISVSWINEMIDGDAIDDLTMQEALTTLGLEVEDTRHFCLKGVIVAEVRSIDPHPKADRLNIVQLHDGNTTVQVVCGASNLPDLGGKIAFAPAGTMLPGEFAIGDRVIRGIESSGMICSESEMDIGNDADGILILNRSAPVGTPLTDLIPQISDTVLEIGVTPNRPDALGHLGVARDLAAKLGRKQSLVFASPAPECETSDGLISLDLAADVYCGRYIACALDGVTVGPSPIEIRVRLHRVGLRAINNVVDATNLVLMETGQPSHAFDRDKLDGGRVVVRLATEGESMTALDGSLLSLGTSDLVIADAKKPQALAGVMGGSDSSVDDTTTRLLLEVAWFAPATVRSSAKRLSLKSDSSHRFERGVDHGAVLEVAQRRALSLLIDLTGGRLVARAERIGTRPSIPEIEFRPTQVEALLGMKVSPERCEEILIRLGIDVTVPTSGDIWSCRPPTHRPDLTLEVDLIEEIMRVHGLKDLPAVYVARQPIDPCEDRLAHGESSAWLVALRAECFHEIMTYAFTEERQLLHFSGVVSADRIVHLLNPMSRKAAVMRTHMMPRMLEAAALNLARHGRGVDLCEVARTYAWAADFTKNEALPQEQKMVAVVSAGHPRMDDRDPDRDVRVTVERLLSVLARLGYRARARPATAVTYLHPGIQIGLWIEDLQVGVVGRVHPDVLGDWEFSENVTVAYGEISLDIIPVPERHQYQAIAKFPSSSRDIALDLPREIAASVVVDHLRSAAVVVLATEKSNTTALELTALDATRETISIVEDYRGKGVKDGRKSLLLRIHYRSQDRSVKDTEVQPIHDAIVMRACESLNEIAVDVHAR